MWWVDLMVTSWRWRRQLAVGRWYINILQHLCVHSCIATECYSDSLHPFFLRFETMNVYFDLVDHWRGFGWLWFCTPPARFSTLPATNGHLGLPCRKGEAWPVGMWNETFCWSTTGAQVGVWMESFEDYQTYWYPIEKRWKTLPFWLDLDL